MNLGKKKKLAARTFGVGTSRIFFVNSRLGEIKEAITKRDIRDLRNSGAIVIKEVHGRRTVERTHSRSPGNIRKNVRTRKKDYVILTRKLRKLVAGLRFAKTINNEDFKDIRKKIRNKYFKNKSHLEDYLKDISKMIAGEKAKNQTTSKRKSLEKEAKKKEQNKSSKTKK